MSGVFAWLLKRDNAGNAASCRACCLFSVPFSVPRQSSWKKQASRCPPSHTTIPYTPPHAQPQGLRQDLLLLLFPLRRPPRAGTESKQTGQALLLSSFAFSDLPTFSLLPSSLHHKPWRVRRKQSETTSWSFFFSSFWCWWPGRIGSALGPALRRSTLRYGRREGGEVEVDDCDSAPSP